MTRSGDDYLKDLRDGRTVWLGRDKVDDITTHPAFANAAQSFANLYDMSRDPALRPEVTARGGETLRSYDIPRTRDDLESKGRAYRAWARSSYGFLGRSPDYMAAGVAGFAARAGVFTTDGYDGASAAMALYDRCRRDSTFLAFTITNPSRDRGAPLHAQTTPELFLSVDRERDDGIVVSGSKMIGTAAVFADEIVVGTIEPLHVSDTEHAFSFTLPVASPGVRLVSRMSYEAQATSAKDYPLSSRFDENDALLICENVFIPWERVLTYRDVGATFGMWWETPAYTYMAHQAATRFWTKMEFLAGVAVLITRANGTAENPAVRSEVGRLLGYVQMAKSMVLAAEAACTADPSDGGAVRPDTPIIYAQRILAGEIYPKFMHQIRMLSGGSLTQVPASWHDLHAPEIAELLRTYGQSVTQSASERVALMKLAWDATSSEFGSRHAHYEQFYQGAPHVYLTQMALAGGADQSAALAQQALDDADRFDGGTH
jgi:4-hydroxyphenylacetate 3-monooxygenase